MLLRIALMWWIYLSVYLCTTYLSLAIKVIPQHCIADPYGARFLSARFKTVKTRLAKDIVACINNRFTREGMAGEIVLHRGVIGARSETRLICLAVGNLQSNPK